ncbi:hypothetical protein [Lacinutrix jangbogonensis]|uniref:hypothetical protein n=1 Tax=Lacinutrix jangbogonensis TaxID=1469557 RepID=UPI00053D8726|nr:hypothetical protein [Lacinutrix jangbogonensis]
MKFYILLVFVFISLSLSNAQTITIKVLGKAAYSSSAEANGVIVSFSESDLKSKKLRLSDSIKVLGIKKGLVPINMPNTKKRNIALK